MTKLFVGQPGYTGSVNNTTFLQGDLFCYLPHPLNYLSIQYQYKFWYFEKYLVDSQRLLYLEKKGGEGR